MTEHLYVVSCAKEGGVLHFVHTEKGPEFREKLPLDRPMHMVTENGRAYILLREIDENGGGLVSCRIGEDGSLSDPSPALSTRGAVPCHLTVRKGQVYAVNYRTGNLIRFPDKVVAHAGHGTDPKRQSGPHTHFIDFTPDGKFLVCCDLGLDRIDVYDKELNPVSHASTPDGHGARHAVFSEDGKWMYCAGEMGSSVSAYRYEAGKLDYVTTVPGLPEIPEGNTAAAIRIRGKDLFVSHRGADVIARFELCDGLPVFRDSFSCGGACPRDFILSGRFLYSANERSDHLAVLEEKDGSFSRVRQRIPVKTPLCVVSLFLPDPH